MSIGETVYLAFVISAFAIFGLSLFTVERRCSR